MATMQFRPIVDNTRCRRPHHPLVWVAACFLVSGTVAQAGLSTIKPPPTVKLRSIKAFLYYHQDRTLSPNVVDNRQFSLFNVFIGEGSAKSPSNATMVVVEVAGRPESDDPRRKVRLVATEGRQVKLDRTVEVGQIGPDGRSFVAFWLYDTGGARIELTASLLGQRPIGRIVKTVPFQSGE